MVQIEDNKARESNLSGIRVCPNCNVKIDTDAIDSLKGDNEGVYCPYCGAKLEINEAPRMQSDQNFSLHVSEQEKGTDRLDQDNATREENNSLENSPLAPLYSDPDFSEDFWDNLIMINSRIFFILIKKLEFGNYTGKAQLRLGRPLIDTLIGQFLRVQKGGIDPFFTKALKNTTPSEFRGQLKKFEDNLKPETDYYEAYLLFLEKIIEMTYTIIYEDWGKAMPHSNRVQVRNDIITFYFMKLYWYPPQKEPLTLLSFKMRPILAREAERFHTPYILSYKSMLLVKDKWIRYGLETGKYPNDGIEIKKDFLQWVRNIDGLSDVDKEAITKTCRNISKEKKLEEYLLFKIFFSNNTIKEIIKEAKGIGLNFEPDELREFAFTRAFKRKMKWYALRFPDEEYGINIESPAPQPNKSPIVKQEKTERFKGAEKKDIIKKPKNKRMSKRILRLALKIYPVLIRQNIREFDLKSLITQFKDRKLDEKTLKALILVLKGTIQIIRRLVWNTLYLCLRELPKEEFDALSEEDIVEKVKHYYSFSVKDWQNNLKKLITKYAGNNIDYSKHLSLQTDLNKILKRLLEFDYSTTGPSIKNEIIKYKLIIGELFNFSEFPSKAEIMKRADVSLELIYLIGHHLYLVSQKEGEYFSIYERFVEVDMEKSIKNQDRRMLYGFPKKVRRHLCRFLYGYLQKNTLLSQDLALGDTQVEALGALLTGFFTDEKIRDKTFIKEFSTWLSPLFRTFTLYGEKKSVPMVIWALKDVLGELKSAQKVLVNEFFKRLVLMVHHVIRGFRQNKIKKTEFEELVQTRSFSGYIDDFIEDISYTITRKFSLRPDVESSKTIFQILSQMMPNRILKIRDFTVEVSDGTLRRKLNNLIEKGIIIKGKEGRSNTYRFSDQYQVSANEKSVYIRKKLLSCIEAKWKKLGYSQKAFIRFKPQLEKSLTSKFQEDEDYLSAFHGPASAASFIYLFIQQAKLKARLLDKIAEIFHIDPLYLKFYFHRYFLPKFPEIQINKIRKQLIKVRALSNKFIQVYGNKLSDDSYRKKFRATDIQEYRPELYDSGGDDFNAIATRFNENFDPHVDIKERTRQCALQYPYFALRNHLIKRGNLKSLSERLISLLRKQQQENLNYNYLQKFIRKGRFEYTRLKQFFSAFRHDIFGAQQQLSSFEINNMIGQLRNILLSESHGKLEALLKKELKQLSTDIRLKKTFLKEIFESITIPQEEVLYYYFKLFIRKFKWDTTHYAKNKKYARSLFIRLFVDGWASKHPNGTIRDFKDYRKQELTKLIPQTPQFALKQNNPVLKSIPPNVYKSELERLGLQALDEVFHALKDVMNAPEGSLLKYIFKPIYHSNKIPSLDYTGYCKYVKTKFKHQIKSLLPTLFSKVDLFGHIIKSLEDINTSFYTDFSSNKHLTLPTIKRLSLPLLQHETYDADYPNHRFLLQLQPRTSFLFRIHDSRTIINRKDENSFRVHNSGAVALNPSITLQGRTLLLNQPFQILKKVGSIRPRRSSSEETPEQSRVLGVDLGLVHWATCSVMNNKQKKELANYFLDSHRVFDCQYDPYFRRNVKGERFYEPTDENLRTKDMNLVEGVRLGSRVDKKEVIKDIKRINRQLSLDNQTKEAYFVRLIIHLNHKELGREMFEALYYAFSKGDSDFIDLLEKAAPTHEHPYIMHILKTLKRHQLEIPNGKANLSTLNRLIKDLLDAPLPKAYNRLSRHDPEKFAELVVGGLFSYLSAIKFFREPIPRESRNRSNGEVEGLGDKRLDRACSLGFKIIATMLPSVSAAEVQKFFTLTFEKAYLRATNIKRKLMVLRSELRTLRQQITTFENTYQGKLYKSRKYYHLKQNERYVSEKMSNIHDDIVHNVARRLVDIARSWGNIPIRFENLKWSKHSKKQKIGKYLAHHQTHWFFSQIIRATSELARRYEVPVVLVNARGTSKRCWKCQNSGSRNGKEFGCTTTSKYRLDADLNAARNVALGIES